MKTFDILITRKVDQVATIRVEARDRRSALLGATLEQAKWVDGARGPLKVVTVKEVAAEELAAE